eukprot:TRINITY_DN51200_c0_g1_i1.p1 TRINITY_DN51200_c0_g1~~TRINITY_DN51200_c0_g1_i1.p1  ORF type:complete len:106 (-),score=12.36 TRINITY_DN51200_c0_g1_i1:37-354(-)
MFFFLMIRRPQRSTLSSSSAASDVYKRQDLQLVVVIDIKVEWCWEDLHHLYQSVLPSFETIPFYIGILCRWRWMPLWGPSVVWTLSRATPTTTPNGHPITSYSGG